MASMKWLHEEDDPSLQVQCEGYCAPFGFMCECRPKQYCEYVKDGLFGFGKACKPASHSQSATGWFALDDGQLQQVVAPVASTGDFDVGDTLGLEMSLFCAPKKDFKPNK